MQRPTLRTAALLALAVGLALAGSELATRDVEIPAHWDRVYVHGDCGFSRAAVLCIAAEAPSSQAPVALIPVRPEDDLARTACAYTRSQLIARGRFWLWFAHPERWCEQLVEAGAEAHVIVAPDLAVPTFLSDDEIFIGLSDEHFAAVGSTCTLASSTGMLLPRTQ